MYGYVLIPEIKDHKAEALRILNTKIQDLVSEAKKLGVNIVFDVTASIKGSGVCNEPVDVERFRNAMLNNSVLYVSANFEIY